MAPHSSFAAAAAPAPSTAALSALADALRVWVDVSEQSTSGTSAERFARLLHREGRAGFDRLVAAGRADLAALFEAQCDCVGTLAGERGPAPGDAEDADFARAWDRTRAVAEGLIAWVEHSISAIANGRTVVRVQPEQAAAVETPDSQDDPERYLPISKVPQVFAQVFPGRTVNRGRAPNILILDYKKDYSKKEFVDATAARVVRPEQLPLNLFDVRDAPDSSKAWLHRARCFIDILSRVYSGIGPVQQERLKNAVRDAYAAAATRSNANRFSRPNPAPGATGPKGYGAPRRTASGVLS